MEIIPPPPHDLDRREFLSMVGKGVGLATLTTGAIAALWSDVQAAARRVDHLSPEQAATDEDFWMTIQDAFVGNRAITNLNNGGVSPSPRMVTEALCRYTWEQEDVPPYTMWQILEPQSETIRKGLADLFGCSPEEIAITRNASESLEALLFGIDLKPGDEILTTTQDYPRMLTTLRQRQRREQVVLRQVRYPVPPKSLDEITDAFARAITPRTRIILVSHIVFLTGQISPVRAICDLGRSKGIEVIVDGAHAFAHLDFKQSDLNCDYFGASLHKWLFAPKGTGILYIKKEKIGSVWSLMGSEESQKDDIRKFEEIGTHSAAIRLAIGEALLFHEGIGPRRKEARLRHLRDYWADQFRDLPNVRLLVKREPEHSAGITTVDVNGIDPGALSGHLFSRHKILTTPIVHDEFRGIRVTPNVYTTHRELDRFCEAVSDVARHGLPK